MNLLSELEKELSIQENLFLEKLRKTENKELSSSFEDVLAIKRTISIMKLAHNNTAPVLVRPSNTLDSNQANDNTNKNFVLSIAVRKVIKSFGGKNFSFMEVFSGLKDSYSEVTEAKKASVSATISNLCTSKEIEKLLELEPGKRATYREIAIKLD
jgi:hypothetical protein